MNESQFGKRMRGSGEIADQIRSMFKLFAKRFGFDSDLPPYNHALFQPPRSSSGQMQLF